MIYVYLQGGLGNQLFQIFTTIAYSLKHKIPFGLPTIKNDLTSPYGEIYKRPLYFDNFFLPCSNLIWWSILLYVSKANVNDMQWYAMIQSWKSQCIFISVEGVC